MSVWSGSVGAKRDGVAEGAPVAPGVDQDAEVAPGFWSGHLSLITDTDAQLQPQCGDHFEDGIKTWAAFT